MNSLEPTNTTGTNGHAAVGDVLYAMSDEQILEMEPEGDASGEEGAGRGGRVAQGDSPAGGAGRGEENPRAENAAGLAPRATDAADGAAQAGEQGPAARQETGHAPEWLARAMSDPERGAEAREFWEGAQKARQEAAAYRAAFATPEEARQLKEIYPGGVNEGRAAAERARQLETIDRLYFGASGGRPEEAAAAREELAQTLLREDPAAFREMVAAGVKILQKATPTGSGQAPAQSHGEKNVVPAAVTGVPHESPVTSHESRQRDSLTAGRKSGGPALGMTEEGVARYAAFERAANEDLNREVGGEIARTIERALPYAETGGDAGRTGQASRGAVASGRGSVQERLSAAIREEVEAGLRSDRQLGEQVARVLGGAGAQGPRLDEEARGQVVRLIGERARQLVPGAARRVLQEWTQTALAAHRARGGRGDAAAARTDVAPANSRSRAGAEAATGLRGSPERPNRQRDAGATRARGVDYRKMSDEQILEM
ncbi:MAG: hypothetical protein LAN84_06480 [Acidobacteriia bacterium]|nr:hypothetical protein [Terriglobia bacterium]